MTSPGMRGVAVAGPSDMPGQMRELVERNHYLESRLAQLEDLARRADDLHRLRPSFKSALLRRVSWLIALLVLQSTSSYILKGYESLLQRHTIIIFFLTMLVGAGGNAGNQSAMLIVRGLATGEVSRKNQSRHILREAQMGFVMSCIMSSAGYARVSFFHSDPDDARAIATALFVIVFLSVNLGTWLPLVLHKLHVDPAHSGASIQVVMDILGVLVTCYVCSVMMPDGTTPPIDIAEVDATDVVSDST